MRAKEQYLPISVKDLVIHKLKTLQICCHDSNAAVTHLFTKDVSPVMN